LAWVLPKEQTTDFQYDFKHDFDPRQFTVHCLDSISSKWVYTIKLNADGTIERFKARLVARGFSQVQGTDYNETFAPTARMDTLRLFLATVAAEDLECAHFDIKNAFTESHLKEEIYLSPPQGLDVKKGCVLQVMRSLYGLKQAARDWNLLIKKELLAWGFVQSKADPCMFIHEERGLRLLVYVDDIVAAAKQQSRAAKQLSDLPGAAKRDLGNRLRYRITGSREAAGSREANTFAVDGERTRLATINHGSLS
jgi:hypothetical protein